LIFYLIILPTRQAILLHQLSAHQTFHQNPIFITNIADLNNHVLSIAKQVALEVVWTMISQALVLCLRHQEYRQLEDQM
jgi:hypothetical protein